MNKEFVTIAPAMAVAPRCQILAPWLYVSRNGNPKFGPAEWRASMTKDFDVVVIGGGPAGISGANTAAIFGKRVALVEKLGKVGGAGINTGTIPSKTLRETALALSGWRSRKLFGVDLSLRREMTVEDFMRWR